MEVGRRSVGSNDDLWENGRKKKPWALPLATLLSLNDRGVHPECPNAANAFHKCGRHCFEKIPSRKTFVDALTSDEDREKKSEKRGANPNCPYASNPFHKCAEYCIEKLPEKRQDDGKIQPVMRLKSSGKLEKVLRNKERTGSSSPCKHASNPYHKCTSLCSQMVPSISLLEGVDLKEVQEVTPDMDHHKGAIEPEGENEITGTVKPNGNHEGKNASTPNNVSAEHCIQSASEDESLGQENLGGVSIATDKAIVHHNHEQLSSPHHKITEHCFEDKFEKKQPEGEMKPKDEIIAFTAQLGVNSECKNASEPNHASQNLPVKGQHGEAFVKSKEDDKVVVPPESGMKSSCKYASNPYHVCADLCLQGVPKGHHLGRALTKSREEKKAIPSTQEVNSGCTNASNPYHKCAEYCSESVPVRDQPGKTIMKSKEKPREEQKPRAVLPPEVVVNPDCKFASNPYHLCAEYCSQKVPETEQRGQVAKLKSLKELKKLVSNRKITGGHPQCSFASNPYHECSKYCTTKNMINSNIPEGAMKTNVRKKENSSSLGRYVNPNCKHASNPFHRCPEYCSEGIGISPKKEEVEGTKELFEEKNRNSFKETTQRHPVAEKKSSVSGRMISKDGAEKNSTESNPVDASNPANNTFDLVSVGGMRNLEEPKDAQTLQLIEANDLFHEWSKYCSQKKVAAADDIVVQKNKVGSRELSARNGRGTVVLNDYGPVKMEKRRTGTGEDEAS